MIRECAYCGRQFKRRVGGGKHVFCSVYCRIVYNNKKQYKSYMLYRAKVRAEKQGLSFSITKRDIVIPDVCPVLGIALKEHIGDGHKNYTNSPSLDRIDNSKGYVPGNVCVISSRANTLKNNATIEELEKVIEYMKGAGVK